MVCYGLFCGHFINDLQGQWIKSTREVLIPSEFWKRKYHIDWTMTVHYQFQNS